MRLRDDVVTYRESDMQYMVLADGSFNGIVRNNDTAAFIADCLRTQTTQAQIVEALLAEYDVQRDQAERCVAQTIEKFRSIGAIED